ncbi:hypothetical protein [Nostoc sp. NZL]|uniref:hypothetical protein n=1 Tax=Nostoc sp. NZL TaxID=2650612 RepID=UPI0018C522BE|nr:hypothetical protein [Nostoc sp. NZL]MBG1240155.1 hypothetical protein [Nostoc sp. NZL]
MVVNLSIQADIIDIKTDNPQQGDIFLVDTNVWFWQTYTNAGALLNHNMNYAIAFSKRPLDNN